MPNLTYSLAEGSALANGDLVTLLDTESGGDVGGEVLMALLVTRVLGDEVKVFAADDDGSVHLGRDDGTGENTATDGDLAGEGALLVCRNQLIAAQKSPSPRSARPVDICPRLAGPKKVWCEFVIRRERTDVLALNGGLGGAEAQTNVLVPSSATLARASGLDLGLAVEEDW